MVSHEDWFRTQRQKVTRKGLALLSKYRTGFQDEDCTSIYVDGFKLKVKIKKQIRIMTDNHLITFYKSKGPLGYLNMQQKALL